MAKSAPATSIPVDQPILTEKGVVHREDEFFAQPVAGSGFYEGAFDGSTTLGAAKGNREAAEFSQNPEASPFTNLRGGFR
jgi:hypothetical protein